MGAASCWLLEIANAMAMRAWIAMGIGMIHHQQTSLAGGAIGVWAPGANWPLRAGHGSLGRREACFGETGANGRWLHQGMVSIPRSSLPCRRKIAPEAGALGRPRHARTLCARLTPSEHVGIASSGHRLLMNQLAVCWLRRYGTTKGAYAVQRAVDRRLKTHQEGDCINPWGTSQLSKEFTERLSRHSVGFRGQPTNAARLGTHSGAAT